MDGVCQGGNETSLAYLFDLNEKDLVIGDNYYPIKKVYQDVDELFTVDGEGHYIFNSDNENGILVCDDEEENCIFSVTEQTKTDNTGFFPVSGGKKPPANNSRPDGWYFGVHIHNDFSIPYDAKVLNPSGEYQDMIFEFTGDDDVWVFIDGILIGDVGGIHSKEYLSINFVTGEVVVKNPANESGTTFKTTIYEMVVAAVGEEEAHNPDRFSWKQEPDGSYKTFEGRTYHTLDFFYLERGAGNSNMEMRFNLISTYDFTAHKSLRLNKHDDVGRKLQENQFRYKLTGYPITVADETGTAVMEPVMPKFQPDHDVIWEPDYDPEKTLTEENAGGVPFVKTLTVGNSLEGNINFGNSDMSDAELELYKGKTFRYMIEELPPVGAVWNDDGTYTYRGETIYQNPDGTYTFDGITYDKTVFYYEGTVSEEGWINKKWYTDKDYSVDAAINFANFDNRYDSIGQAILEGNKEFLKASGEQMTELEPNRFKFKLTNVTNPDSPVVVQPSTGKPAAENDGSGHFSFDPIGYTLADDMPAGTSEYILTYLIEEIQDQPEAVIYSDAVYYARVRLTDAGEGKLSVNVSYYGKCGADGCPEDLPEEERFCPQGADECFKRIPAAEVIFTNQNKTNLTIDKTVVGNLGSRNRDFEFSLTMPEMEGKTVSCVKVSRSGNAVTEEISFSPEGIASFSLKHGEKITFYGIEGDFSVAESSSAEDYDTSWIASDDPETTHKGRTAAGAVTLDNESVTVSYTNTLEVTPPTRIRDPLGPALAGIAVSGLMLLTLGTGKKRKAHD